MTLKTLNTSLKESDNCSQVNVPAGTRPVGGSSGPGQSASSQPSPPAHSPERPGSLGSVCWLAAGLWPYERQREAA